MALEIELSQIEHRYEALRIHERTRLSQLTTSLLENGQHTPVLVVRVAEDTERYVLIDGYARVAVLKRLGRDVVRALVLDLGEAEALLFAHQLHSHRSRSVLEEAWLLRELVEFHRWTLGSLAQKLGRTKSWVSRRLSLVRLLPEVVHEAVNEGRIAAHAAMKFLVPLARANRADCIRLIAQLGSEAVSVRQVERLYAAWRTASEEQQKRIVDEPHLFLRASEEIKHPEPPLGSRGYKELPSLIKDLSVIAALCHRARQRIEALGGVRRDDVSRAFVRARLAFGSLTALMEGSDDRSGHAHGRLALAP